VPHADEDKHVRIHPVSPAYFRALSIPLLAGRPFATSDRYGAPRVAVINETMARHYFRGTDPVGKRFSWWPTDPKNIEIVGVVRMPSMTTSGRRRGAWYTCRSCRRGLARTSCRFEAHRQ
jgi:hypothetical protein